MDIRFICKEENKEDEERESHIRVYLMVQGQHYIADVNLADSTTTLKAASLFEDQSVLA